MATRPTRRRIEQAKLWGPWPNLGAKLGHRGERAQSRGRPAATLIDDETLAGLGRGTVIVDPAPAATRPAPSPTKPSTSPAEDLY